MKMYNDIIFGLYSPKELVEWDQEINHGSDGSSEEHYLCLDSEVAKELYGDEKDSDWRFKYQTGRNVLWILLSYFEILQTDGEYYCRNNK